MQSQVSSIPHKSRFLAWFRNRLSQRVDPSRNTAIEQLTEQEVTKLAQSLTLWSVKFGILFDGILLLWTWYLAFERHRIPPLAFYNYLLNATLPIPIMLVLLRKRRPFAALTVGIILRHIYLFANMWVLHNIGVFFFSITVLIIPALVFRTRTMTLILIMITTTLYTFVALVPELRTLESAGAVALLGGVVMGVVGMFMGIGHEIRRRLQDAVEVSIEREAQAAARARAEAHAAQAAELAAATTRNQIAGQLHDSLGHYLTKLSLKGEAVARDFDRNPTRALESLQTVQALAREASTALRQSVTALHTASIESQPFIKAIQKLVTEADLAGVRTEFNPLGETRLLPPQVNSVLYSAIQESLTNVHKHAQASQITLTLDYRCPTSIRLVVHDDGCGAPDLMEGHGLGFMRERVTQMGGTLDISTKVGQGLTLSMEVPT